MTPQELLARIEQLERMVDSLANSALIPRDVETAFNERLRIDKKLEATIAGTGSATAATVYGAFPVTAPAQPSGTLQVVYNGTTYELLYK